MKQHVSLTSIVVLSLALGASAQQARLEAGYPSLLSSNPVYAEEHGAQRAGNIVPTDEGWIVAWADDSNPYWPTAHRRILATRLLPDGTVIDTTGIRLSDEDSYASFTCVSDGSGARVFWIPQALASKELSFATLSNNGNVTHSSLTSGYSADYVPTAIAAAVAGSRTALLVQGQVMLYDGSRYLRTVDIGGVGEPSSIVATSSHFVVTWVAAGNVFMCQTLDLDGNPTGPPGGTGVGFPVSSGSAAANHTGAILAWGEGAWVRTATVNATTGRIEQKASVPAEYAAPRVVWTGTSYLVAWSNSEGQGLDGVHVSANGELLDTEPLRIYSIFPGYFTLAARDGVVIMLHETGGCVRVVCETDVWATTLEPGPPVTRPVSSAARWQLPSAVVSNGSGFLSLWREGHDLVANLTDARDPKPTDPFPLAVSFDTDGAPGALASNGRDYLAIWVALRQSRLYLEGAPVNANGHALPERTFSIDIETPGIPTRSFIAGSPELYLAAWQTSSGANAVRVHLDGTLLDSVPLSLSNTLTSATLSSAAFDGRDFVVASLRYDGGPDSEGSILTNRITLGGSVSLDRVWAEGSTVSYYAASPALGCGPDGCLIIWNERADPYGLSWRLRGRRFRTGGVPIDNEAFSIASADSIPGIPRVSWDGNRFVVSWRGYDKERDSYTVEARVVPTSGAFDESTAFDSDRLAEGTQFVSSACNRSGTCLLLQSGDVDDTVLGRTIRLFKSWFGEARHRGVRR